MWRSVGLVRTREGLGDAVAALGRAMTPASAATADAWRDRNLLTVARLIAGAALRREESRGGHYREDFPQRNDRQWKIHVVEEG
jgi:L-aspartate oxidase